MEKVEALKAAYETLEHFDVDPRANFMVELRKMIDQPRDIPESKIKLVAAIAPGGKYEVTDQNGRVVDGVKSVGCFQDQQGEMVFQVNL